MFLRCLGGDEVEIWKDWGSGGPFSGVLSKNMAENVVGAMVAVLSRGRSGGFVGVFFSVKTPKKHFQKCQICPKQVGMDSQATFGVYLCQRRLCDVKKYAVF